MTVRRLAEKQPESFAFTPANLAWCERQIAKYPPGRQASAVLALLWRAQSQNGYWLPRAAIECVARMLALPDIRVLEIATFYSMFNLAPVGRYYIQMCGTTPCVLAGSDAIKAILRERIGASGETTKDGLFSWVEVECLGACCNAPMAQINEDYFEDLTPENFSKLLDDLAAGQPVRKGSQIGRRSSEPVGGLTSLTTFYGVDGRSGPACAASHERSEPNIVAAEENARRHDGLGGAPAQERLALDKGLALGAPSDSIVEAPGRTPVGVETRGRKIESAAKEKATNGRAAKSSPPRDPSAAEPARLNETQAFEQANATPGGDSGDIVQTAGAPRAKRDKQKQ